jgi:hypothetical protein
MPSQRSPPRDQVAEIHICSQILLPEAGIEIAAGEELMLPIGPERATGVTLVKASGYLPVVDREQ